MQRNWVDDDAYLCGDNKCYYYKFMSNEGKNPHLKIVDMQYIEGTKKLNTFCSISRNPPFYRTFYNFSTFREFDEKSASTMIEAARASGTPLVTATFSDDVSKKLVSHGWYSFGSQSPQMYMDIPRDTKSKPPPDGFEIGELTSNKDELIQNWVKLLASVMSMNTQALENVITNAPCGPKESLRHFYILDKDKKIVSVSTVFFDENVAGIYNMASNPEYRGKGLAKRLLEKMIYDVARDEKGYRYAVLQSAPKAIELYKGIGFRVSEDIHFNIRLEQADLLPRIIGTPIAIIVTNFKMIKNTAIVLVIVLISWIFYKYFK